MASNLTWVFVLVLCLELVLRGVYGMRNAPVWRGGATGVSAEGPSPDGTCKSMVQIYGYECQEHTVLHPTQTFCLFIILQVFESTPSIQF